MSSRAPVPIMSISLEKQATTTLSAESLAVELNHNLTTCQHMLNRHYPGSTVSASGKLDIFPVPNTRVVDLVLGVIDRCEFFNNTSHIFTLIPTLTSRFQASLESFDFKSSSPHRFGLGKREAKKFKVADDALTILNTFYPFCMSALLKLKEDANSENLFPFTFLLKESQTAEKRAKRETLSQLFEQLELIERDAASRTTEVNDEGPLSNDALESRLTFAISTCLLTLKTIEKSGTTTQRMLSEISQSLTVSDTAAFGASHPTNTSMVDINVTRMLDASYSSTT